MDRTPLIKPHIKTDIMVTARTPRRHSSMVSECTLQRAGPLTKGTVKAGRISAGGIDGFMNKWVDACMRMARMKMICDINQASLSNPSNRKVICKLTIAVTG